MDEHLCPNRTVVLGELLKLGPGGAELCGETADAPTAEPGTGKRARWLGSWRTVGRNRSRTSANINDKTGAPLPSRRPKGDRISNLPIRNIPVPAFEGVVVGMGLDDELTGQMFAAVRTSAGTGYYIRLRPEVAGIFAPAEMVRVGFQTEQWLKPADRIIARFTQENGRHLRSEAPPTSL